MFMNNGVKTSDSTAREKFVFQGSCKKNEIYFLNSIFFIPGQFFQVHILYIKHMKEVNFLTHTQWGVAR